MLELYSRNRLQFTKCEEEMLLTLQEIYWNKSR